MPKSRRKPKAGKADFKLKAAQVQLQAHYKARRIAQALSVLEGLMAKGQKSAALFADAAVCCVFSERWDDAIAYGKKAVALEPKRLAALDALAHAMGAVKDWEGVRLYGSRALTLQTDMVVDVKPLSLKVRLL